MSVFGGYKGHWEPTEAVVVTAESYLEAAEAAINSINVRDLIRFDSFQLHIQFNVMHKLSHKQILA